MTGIPKKYLNSISEFWKDDYGWWLTLKKDGDYTLKGYYYKMVIHEDTKIEVIKTLKKYAVKK